MINTIESETSSSINPEPKNQKNKHGMFQKKYYQRHITFFVLLILLVLYMFTGGIATEWRDVANIDIANYVFIGLNCGIICLVNYEILRLVAGTSWPIYTQILTYLLIVFLFLFPVEKVATSYDGIGALNFPFYTLLNWTWLEPWIIILLYLFVVLIYCSLIFSSKAISFAKMIFLIAFSIYLVFALKAMTKFMLNPQYGWSSVLWLALIIILTDTCAFIGGVSYGKHKLAPNISPNKTWEGAITGTIAGSGIAILYAILMFNYSSSHTWVFNFFSNDSSQNTMRYIIYVLLAILLSVVSQMGDLSFSWIKRRYDIKDFSNLLPGHGGVLDRLDSFSLVFFVMYLISAISLPN